jgi:hypothetical protein
LFYLPLAVITWLCARWIIDRSKLPGLLLYGLFGAILATVQDRLVILHQLWEYRDRGPVGTHAQIALLISASAAPVFGMRFAQGLQPGAPIPWRRIARFTGISMLPEVVGYLTHNIAYHHGWNLFWSVLAYMPIWLSFWGLHRWMTGPAAAPAAPGPVAPENQTAPGT